jgi:hypothetical protein
VKSTLNAQSIKSFIIKSYYIFPILRAKSLAANHSLICDRSNLTLYRNHKNFYYELWH